MASIERTAYPQFPRTLTLKDLQASFTPKPEELSWGLAFARGIDRRLALMVLLKCFQYLRYFPDIDAIPCQLVEHVCATMGIAAQSTIDYPQAHRSLYRHHEVIRQLLGVKPYSDAQTGVLAMTAAQQAAEIVETRTDIINIMVEELVRLDFELPAFSTLDSMAESAHALAQDVINARILERLSVAQQAALDQLLQTDLSVRRTLYNQIKRSAKNTSRKHLDLLVDQVNWLGSLPDYEAALADVATNKLKHMAEMASVLDAGELKDFVPARRYAMILALIRQMQIRARDDVAEMFIRRISIVHKTAREELLSIQARQRELSEELVASLEEVLEVLGEGLGDADTGKRVREVLAPDGNLDQLRADCEAIRVWSGSNHLPLVWKPFSNWRAGLFKMAKALEFESATTDQSLMKALELVLDNEHRKSEWIENVVDLSFTAERWRKLIVRSSLKGHPTNRRYLEVCVFSHLCNDLRSGDVCIDGSDTFSDHRKQLLPWDECLKKLPDYCDRIGLPTTAQDFVGELKKLLTDVAEKVDKEFPQHEGDVVISASGEPTLRKTTAREIPASAIALQAAMESRVKPRNLLDIIANIDHWTGFTRHFGPKSGDEPKLRNARERYLLTIFAMGCNLGPAEAARHLSNGVTPHQLSFVDRRHMSLDQLESASRDLNELYLRLDLPKVWGEGKKVAADGTQYDFYDQNLLVGMHFRYRRMGAVAYRHVADNYIAVFRHFIPPGVLEAIYVIEGLMNTGLSVQPDTVYSDTHGQSEGVYAFTYLSGIQLMPRIRNWKDLHFYRPDKATRYTHIDKLFTDTINWKLIQDYWQDLMQIAISIQAGRIASPVLLKKLSQEGRNNRLFVAARELGRVLRTVYLLRWISSKEMRQEVNATTNKIESYHSFTKWLDFGGEVITENDPNEQQKRLRYIDLVASAVILQNTVDMMRILQDMHAAGEPVSSADLEFFSPYGRNGVKRFGSFHLDMNRPPEPWLKEAVFREAVEQARRAAQGAQRVPTPTASTNV